MTKKKSRKVAKRSEPTRMVKTKQKVATGIPILNNILVTGLVGLLCFVLYNQFSGYQWVHINLINTNLDYAEKWKDKTLDEKESIKFGMNANYLNYLVDNTPEDAIVLFPPKDNLPKHKDHQKINTMLRRRTYVTHFVYPRRIVYKDESDNPFMNDVTHVAIIDGWGYDQLKYPVTQRTLNTVLPINRETNDAN